MDVSVVEQAISGVVSGWRGDAPRVRVVGSSAELPEAIRRAPGSAEAEGVYWRGEVYLVASRLRSERRVLEVLAHEAIGHYGIEAITGPELWGEIGRLVKRMRESGQQGELFAELSRRGYRPEDPAYTREVVAVLAERGTRCTVLDRVEGACRRFLRGLGFRVEWSVAELRGLITRAARHVERAPEAAAAVDLEAAPAMRSDSRFTDTFRRWFGNSRVVDEKGEPRVMFHGTHRDVDAFTTPLIWVSENAEHAAGYAESGAALRDGGTGAAVVMPLHVAIERPFDADVDADKGYVGNYMTIRMLVDSAIRQAREAGVEVSDADEARYRSVLQNAWNSAGLDNSLVDTHHHWSMIGKPGIFLLRDMLTNLGFDGIRYVERSMLADTGHLTYAAFRPMQVKSAIGNNGLYDAADSRITFSRAKRVASDATRAWAAGTVVVDADGDPLVVYRGEYGRDTGVFRTQLASITFSSDPSVASVYALNPNNARAVEEGRAEAGSARVVPSFLKILRPIVNTPDDPFVEFFDIASAIGGDRAAFYARRFSEWVEQTDAWSGGFGRQYRSVDALLDEQPAAVSQLAMLAYPLLDDPVFVEEARRLGFDGAIHGGMAVSHNTTEFRVFSPSQARSAIADIDPELHRWFAGSKVVDQLGQPLIVFHGTRSRGEVIEAFDLAEAGKMDSGWLGRGFYFGQAATASAYAGYYEWAPQAFPQGGVVYPVYLALKNPLVLVDGDRSDGPRTMVREALDLADGSTGDEVRDALIAAGYDGVIYRRVGPERDYLEYAALHPQQIKSAVANLGTYDPADARILHSRAPAFYSALSRSVEMGRGAPRRATAEVWRGWLDGAQRRGEFKAAERAWSGVDDWLAGKEGVLVDRLALVDVVAANALQLEETVLHAEAMPEPVSADLAAWMRAAGHPDPNDIGEWMAVDWKAIRGLLLAERRSDLSAEVEGIMLAIEHGYLATTPRYGKYQLPGGEDYREILIRMPTPAAQVEYQVCGALPMSGLKSREEALEYIRNIEEMVEKHPEIKGPLNLERYPLQIREYPTKASLKKQWAHNHWRGIVNVLVHLRVNERCDEHGRRALFVEEVQSDWHQEGRKRGYAADANGLKGLRAAHRNLLDRLAIESDYEIRQGGETVVEMRAKARTIAEEIVAKERLIEEGVPEAPFRSVDEWALLGIKRAVAEAVSRGIDLVAWTSGEVQAERYELVKSIDAIEFIRRGEDEYFVEAFPKGSANPVWHAMSASLASIEKALGRGVAQAIAERSPEVVRGTAVPSRLQGAELRVGGDGMRAFYDRILPAAVGRWAKRFGASVSSARFQTSDVDRVVDSLGFDASAVRVYREPSGHWAVERADAHVRAGEGRYWTGAVWTAQEDQQRLFGSEAEARQSVFFAPQHVLEITPAMKEAVLSGLPMFSRADPASEDRPVLFDVAGADRGHFEFVAHERRTRPEERVDARGNEYVARVADWDRSEISAGSGRRIVEIYWMRDRRTGVIHPFGMETAPQAAGRTRQRLEGLVAEQRGRALAALSGVAHEILPKMKVSDSRWRSVNAAANLYRSVVEGDFRETARVLLDAAAAYQAFPSPHSWTRPAFDAVEALANGGRSHHEEVAMPSPDLKVS